MPRREYRSRFNCAEPGCKEMQYYTHSTRADEKETYAYQQRSPFRCTRHAHPEQNLKPGNEQTRRVLVASRVKSDFPDIPLYNTDPDWPYLKGLFWLEEGKERGGNGFSFGPGFTAHASDFPEGSRLVVTAQIEMPERDCPAVPDRAVSRKEG
jgi:hypothetical protein